MTERETSAAKPPRHWERLLFIVPASMFAMLGSALVSMASDDPWHGFADTAANIGALIFGGSIGLLGFLGIPAAIVSVFDNEEVTDAKPAQIWR